VITKINLIETLQNRLSGGDCPDDIKGQYHPQIIEQVIQGVFSDVVALNPKNYKYMGVRKVVKPIEMKDCKDCDDKKGDWVATLPVKPLQGSKSILFAYGCDEKDWYVITQGEFGHLMMNILKPGRCRVSLYYSNGKVVFSGKPYEEVTLFLIPNVSDMGENEEIVLPGSEAAFIDACFSMIRKMDVPRVETVNDTRDDGAAG